MNGSRGSFISAIRGPIILITIGGLFALNNFTPYGFHNTWPVILIVVGLLSLAGRGLSPAPPAAPPYMGAPPSYPPPPYNPPPSGGYRQSAYTQPPAAQGEAQPPAGTAKGGFGSSAPRNTAPPPGQGGEA